MTPATRYLLTAAVIAWGLAAIFAHSADRPGDDFGAVVPAILCGIVALALTIATALSAIFS